jgi:hypothetical protein
MTAPQMTNRQADALSDFVRAYKHTGPVRVSVSPTSMSGRVLLAELLDGDTVIADRILHVHGSYTP